MPAVIGLVCVVLAGDIVPKHPLVWLPVKPMPELGMVSFAENIFVSNYSPDAESAFKPGFYRLNFGIWNEVIYHGFNSRFLVRPERIEGRLFCIIGRQWKIKLFKRLYGQDGHVLSYTNLPSRSITSVHNFCIPLKFKIRLALPAFLVNSSTDHYGQVGPRKQLISFFDRSGNVFHSIRRTLGLSDVAIHGFTLFGSTINGFLQHYGLSTEDYELQYANRCKSISRIYEVAIGLRFLLAICFLSFGFFYAFRGWGYLYDKRRFLGSTFLLLSGLLVCAGFGVMLC